MTERAITRWPTILGSLHFDVSATLNRNNGAQGPDSWLPRNERLHCQYVTRFYRVLLKYEFPEAVRSHAKVIMNSKC